MYLISLDFESQNNVDSCEFEIDSYNLFYCIVVLNCHFCREFVACENKNISNSFTKNGIDVCISIIIKSEVLCNFCSLMIHV